MKIQNIQGKYTPNSLFVEGYTNDKKKVIIRGLMLPKNKISRNNVMYEWESIKQKHSELVSKPVMYNHKIDSELPPAGHYTDSVCLEQCPSEDSKWFNAWKRTEKENNAEVPGWYYEANLDPDNAYTKSVLRGDLNKVSIQLFADQAIEKEDYESGNRYTLAYVGSILEGSLVPVPGFTQTSIDVALAEALKMGKNTPLYFMENVVTKSVVPVFKEGVLSVKVDKNIRTGEYPENDELEMLQQMVKGYITMLGYSADVSIQGASKEELNTTTGGGSATLILSPPKKQKEFVDFVESLTDVQAEQLLSFIKYI